MPDWKDSPLQRAEIAAIAAVGVPAIAALGASLRWRVEGVANLQFEGPGRRPIMAFWHGRILTATYYFRNRAIVVMISENFDGEWIARIIEAFGYGTSRGSTSRGGQRALLQLKRQMEEGKPAGFAVDVLALASPKACAMVWPSGRFLAFNFLPASRHSSQVAGYFSGP